MNQSDLDDAFIRLLRLTSNIEEKAGKGFVDVYQNPQGEIYTHQVSGIKSMTDIKDELLNATTWAWNIKDYLKEMAKKNGVEPQLIEDLVNRTISLQLIADIANRAKHGVLTKSRSGRYARLQPLEVSIPQLGIGSLKFEDRQMITLVSDPTTVTYKAKITSTEGDDLGDLFYILKQTISIWETEGFSIAGSSR